MNTNLTTEEQEELAKTNYPEFLKLADYWRKADRYHYIMYIAPLIEKYKEPPFQSQAKRKRSTLVFAVAGFILVMGIAGVVFMLNNNSGSKKYPKYEISYEVTGTTKTASITMQNENGKNEQYNNVELPWKKIMRVNWGKHLFILAHNNDNSGTMTTRIFIDGKLIQESSSSEPHGIASVTGTVK